MPGASGFLSTVLDTTGQRLKDRMAREEDFRKTQTQSLLDSIHAVDDQGNPKLDDNQREQAFDEIQRLNSSPGAKDILKKARDIYGAIFQHGAKLNQAMLQRTGQQTSQALNGQGGGSLVAAPAPQASQPLDAGATEGSTSGMGETPTPNPAGASSGGGMAFTPPPPQRTAAPASVSQNPTQPPVSAAPARKSMSSIIAAGSPAAQQMATTKAQQEAQATTQARLQEEMEKRQIDLANATQHAKLDYELELDQKRRATRLKEGKDMGLTGSQLAQYVQGSGSIAYKPFNRPATKGSDIKNELAAKGEPLIDANHNPIDDNEFYDIHDTGAGLVVSKELPDYSGTPQWALRQADNKWVYSSIDKKGHHPPVIHDDTGMVPPSALSIAGMHEIPMIGSDGQVHMVPSEYVRAKQAPSGGGAGAGTQPSSKPSPAAGGGGAGSSSTGGTGRVLPDVLPVGLWNSEQTAATPLRTMRSQLFGDPKTGLEGLKDFADLSDDPVAKKNIGTAFNMIVGDLEKAQAEGGGNVGAGAGPISAGMSFGTIAKAIENNVGFTKYLAGSEVNALQSAIGAIKDPRQQRALDRLLSTWGTIVGLRKQTGGGAYKFSTATLERELPLIFNVNNSAQFNDKLGSIAQELTEGSKKFSPSVLRDTPYYDQLTAELIAKGKGEKPAASGTPPNPYAPKKKPK